MDNRYQSESQLLKIGVYVGVGVFILIFASWMFGINSLGERTVIQYPTGGISVKFDPGVYLQAFGHTTTYNDVISYNFDKTGQIVTLTVPGIPDVNNPAARPEPQTFEEDTGGISVKYHDGGRGKVYGIARFNLPINEEEMIAMHKAFRDADNLTIKLLQPVTEEALNLTAGLMTSEQAYAENRNSFIEMSRDQLQNGKYKTQIRQVVETEEIPIIEETGDSGKQTVSKMETKTITKNIPVIAYEEGGIIPKRLGSDLKIYGITVSGYPITDWGFEPKTMQQISAKRNAVMAIITSKAEADKARQDAITAQQTGLAHVMEARYRKEVTKAEAVVEAEQNKEVAIILAQQNVSVAEQEKKEAEQKKLAAAEYKQEQQLRGEGDAAYKKAVITADGALTQKLETLVKISTVYADALSKQPQVPQITMGGSNSNTNTLSLVDLLTAKTAKQLALDLKVPE
jgi:hypothetical protein